MNDAELLARFVNRKDPLAKLLWAFRSECARLEQAEEQRRPPTTSQRLMMEFEAVRKMVLTLEAGGYIELTDKLKKDLELS